MKNMIAIVMVMVTVAGLSLPCFAGQQGGTNMINPDLAKLISATPKLPKLPIKAPPLPRIRIGGRPRP